LNFRPGSQRLIEQLLFFDYGKVIELQAVGDFNVLVGRQIQEFRQAVLGRVSQRLRVDQILALVLQFDVGSHGVNIQADARFLEFGGLVVKAMCKRDASTGASRVARARRICRYWSTTAVTTFSRVVRSSERASRFSSRPI
jgi:hypothetical protein